MYDNSYAEYERIIDGLKATNRLCLFEQAAKRNSFIVLRHDVEFSIEKAVEMAAVEAEHGVKASYFVQVESNAYNTFSDEHRAALRMMSLYGHEIGLHYRQRGGNAEEMIRKQINILSDWLGVPVKTFSTHRPKQDTPYDLYFVPGAINAYGKHFFTKTDDLDKVRVKYISDSKFRWNYGSEPLEAISGYDKAQILIHPFQWAEELVSMAECFTEITQQKAAAMMKTYRNEFTRYREVENA